jgi:hypothetical protein
LSPGASGTISAARPPIATRPSAGTSLLSRTAKFVARGGSGVDHTPVPESAGTNVTLESLPSSNTSSTSRAPPAPGRLTIRWRPVACT